MTFRVLVLALTLAACERPSTPTPRAQPLLRELANRHDDTRATLRAFRGGGPSRVEGRLVASVE